MLFEGRTEAQCDRMNEENEGKELVVTRTRTWLKLERFNLIQKNRKPENHVENFTKLARITVKIFQ